MVWRSFDAYLFDIDGTLVTSRDAVHYNAFHSALQSVFQCGARIDSVPLQGNTDIGILRATSLLGGIEERDFEVNLENALSCMRAEVEQNCAGMRPEICPSIEDLLQQLQRAGKLLGVASGNLSSIGWRKLEAAGLRHYFSLGAFSDSAERRDDIFRNAAVQARNLLNRRGPGTRICFVGDTPADIRAAHAAGGSVIAVASGIFTYDQLLAESPDLCIACCSDLLEQNLTVSS